MTVPRLSRLCAALLIGLVACAPATPSETPGPTSLTPVSIHITNDSPEIVRIALVTDAGLKLPIGTIAPYAKADVRAMLSRTHAGHFYAHRLSTDVPTRLAGSIEPSDRSDRKVLIRIGENPGFDYWQIGR